MPNPPVRTLDNYPGNRKKRTLPGKTKAPDVPVQAPTDPGFQEMVKRKPATAAVPLGTPHVNEAFDELLGPSTR